MCLVSRLSLCIAQHESSNCGVESIIGEKTQIAVQQLDVCLDEQQRGQC